MTLDQRLSRAAHQVADGLTPPVVDVDRIRARARSDHRRRIVGVAAASLTAVVAVGVVVVGDRDVGAPAPVGPLPTISTPTTPTTPTTPETSAREKTRFPASMSPEEVVAEPGAQLRTVAVAPDDPDTRISMWSYTCSRPCPKSGPFEFTAMALTTDAYATATYVRAGIPLSVDLSVSSPVDGVFLVVEQSNGGEWLVSPDGTVRPVLRVDEEIRPADPRLWFQCSGSWRSNWCSLDPITATAHQWPGVWEGSAASPAVGDPPWGANPEPRATSTSGRLEAWWDTEEGRQLRTLATVHQGDYILDSPPGEMAYWSRADGADTIELHTSRDGGATWEVDTREAPDVDGYMQLRRSPDGAYLAYSIYPRLAVWRAEASGGPFEQVYEQAGRSSVETTGAGLWSQGELVYATANARVAISEDDGRTWTTIDTWR